MLKVYEEGVPLQLVHILGIFQDTPDASISEPGDDHIFSVHITNNIAVQL
jgi:hypothetical protein